MYFFTQIYLFDKVEMFMMLFLVLFLSHAHLFVEELNRHHCPHFYGSSLCSRPGFLLPHTQLLHYFIT